MNCKLTTNEHLIRRFRSCSREYALASEPRDRETWGCRCERAAASLKARMLTVPSLRFNLAGDVDDTGERQGY